MNSITRQVTWPAGEHSQAYEDCVLEGILDVLLVQREPMPGISVTLEDIAWHEVDSCAIGYCIAAQNAIAKILEAGGSEFP